MSFVLIPAGSFIMGSPAAEPERDPDERQHPVTISKPFYLQTTQVTQKQWAQVMGINPSRFKDCGGDCPVDSISWEDAQEFIRRLNQQERVNKYRLPSEAEWEYACRAGTSTPFYTGRCVSTNEANYNGNSPLSGCPKGENRKRSLPVSSFPANPWGLYDMHGNVWEWCQDWYGDYPTGHVTDPTGPACGEKRVLRGGSWVCVAWGIRSAIRSWLRPGDRGGVIGFRLARDL
jgi:formylglycine-generating enzyme required for sulfatase activity